MVRVKRHISGLSDDEYVQLLKDLSEQQYSESEDDDDMPYGFTESYIPDDEWTPDTSQSYLKKGDRSVIPSVKGPIDLTNAKMTEIEDKLHSTGLIKIGFFFVRIKRYDVKDNEVTLDLEISQEKQKNFGDKSYKMPEKVSIRKDTRFCNKSWAKYFNPLSGGQKIPIDIAADIIKYLQFVFANPAFL